MNGNFFKQGEKKIALHGGVGVMIMMMVLSLYAGKVLVRMAMMTDKHPP